MLELNRLYLMDCMEGMAQMPDKYFELCICDPPYGLPKESTHGRGKLKNRILNSGGLERWDKKPSPEYFQELFRVSKNQIIWGGNYFDLPPTRGVICWDKCQPWENFSQWEMAWTSFDKPASMFKFDNRTTDKIHPTQKPVALYEWLLKNYAKPGDKILDTHVGSASSLIACHKMGFDYLGFEIDEEYYNKAKKRLDEARAQQTIFGLEGLK
ncbi:MAG: DNA methyltransferase [Anaerovoracaceae bacterium]